MLSLSSRARNVLKLLLSYIDPLVTNFFHNCFSNYGTPGLTVEASERTGAGIHVSSSIIKRHRDSLCTLRPLLVSVLSMIVRDSSE